MLQAGELGPGARGILPYLAEATVEPGAKRLSLGLGFSFLWGTSRRPVCV